MSLKQLLKLLRENPKMIRWKKRAPNRWSIKSLQQQKRRNENGRVITFIICRSQLRHGKLRNRPIHARYRPIANLKKITRMRETQNLGHILLSRILTMCIILSPLRTLLFIIALIFLYI